MNKKILNEIKKICEEDSETESCGFVLNKNKKSIVVKCQNISQDQSQNFQISDEEYMFAYKNYKIESVFHSHVLGDESFSKLDKSISTQLDIPIIVYSLKTKKFNFFDPHEEKNI